MNEPRSTNRGALQSDKIRLTVTLIDPDKKSKDFIAERVGLARKGKCGNFRKCDDLPDPDRIYKEKCAYLNPDKLDDEEIPDCLPEWVVRARKEKCGYLRECALRTGRAAWRIMGGAV